MRILITGNLGFVGTATQKFLESKSIEVIGYDLMDKQDICDYSQFKEYVRIKNPDRILHLGAIARFADADKNPKLAHSTNVLGTINIVNVCKEFHIPLVYASTGSVYMPIKLKPPITESFPIMGNSVYGCTKALGELYVQECNPYIILRYAHLYGKEKRMHGLIGGFLDRISRGLEPTLYGGKQSNDFTYIDDVATANYLALTAPWDKWNQAYNIGTGEELSAEQAGKIVCEIAGYTGKIIVNEQRGVDPDRFVFDISKAQVMLGFKAKYTFKEGMEKMYGL